MDFNFITGRLATGGAVGDHGGVQQLIDAGITDIIDCQQEFDDHGLLADIPGVNLLWIGVGDDGQPKPVDWFEKGIEFALDALSHPRRKVIAHCAAGYNRGPSMAYAILRSLGFSGDATMVMLLAVRQVGVAYRADADSAVTTLGYAP